MRQRTISDYFWRDPQINGLTQEDKATLLYFLTSPSSNLIGIYQVVWRIAAAEMGWTAEQLLAVLERLQSKELIVYREDGWIWVKVWWKHNSAAGSFSPKLKKNSIKQISDIPPEWLGEFIKTLETAGVDRVSIGYQYSIDTSPPNSSSISLSRTAVSDRLALMRQAISKST